MANEIKDSDKKARRKAYEAAWRAKNADRVRATSAAYRAKNSERIKDYYADNADKLTAAALAWQKANPERVLATKLAYAEAHPEKSRESTASYRKANPDRIKASIAAWTKANPGGQQKASTAWRRRNPEKAREATAKWLSANPGATAVYTQNRRARKIAGGGSLSRGLADRLLDVQQGICPCCSLPLDGEYHLDHWMPLALGGSNTDDNMRLLHPRCNLQKGAKHPDEFMKSRLISVAENSLFDG